MPCYTKVLHNVKFAIIEDNRLMSVFQVHDIEFACMFSLGRAGIAMCKVNYLCDPRYMRGFLAELKNRE